MIKCTYTATEYAYFHTILKAKTVFIVFDQIWPTIIADILKRAFNGPFPIVKNRPIYTLYFRLHILYICCFAHSCSLDLELKGK